jgi:diadenosine tetraphosphate (Ap4A) HIT family hydrolase
MTTAYEQLKYFLQNQMQMQHIYQPVMLRTILQNGGKATVREIAQEFLRGDHSQLEYYEKITKQVPGNVLARRHIVQRHGSEYRLIPSFSELTYNERTELIELCNEKLRLFLEARSLDPWEHRRKVGYVPGSLRYEVLKRAGGRCEACGVSVETKALEVDHIVPRNKGGSNDLTNLQALCYTCNAQKRDTDSTNFHALKETFKNRRKGCPFCGIEARKSIMENELAFAIYDKYPVTQFHTLIIPKRHLSNLFEMYQSELNAVHKLLYEMRATIVARDRTVEGFNFGANAGEAAGQTVPHCHFHLIPRRPNDVEDPRGGIRGVISNKQLYG